MAARPAITDNLRVTTFIEAIEAIRRARAWADAAPRYSGEFSFGEDDGRPARLLAVFGDSLGCGVGVSDIKHTFAGVVAQRLAERSRVVCRISAISGAQAPELSTQNVLGDERLCFVSIGTNDLLHGAPIRRFEHSLAIFLTRLAHAERVVVLGPGNVAQLEILPHALRPLLRRRMLAWEACMTRLAGKFANAIHVGPSDAELTLEPADFAADGFHPGDRGQRRIGEVVYRRLAS